MLVGEGAKLLDSTRAVNIRTGVRGGLAVKFREVFKAVK